MPLAEILGQHRQSLFATILLVSSEKHYMLPAARAGLRGVDDRSVSRCCGDYSERAKERENPGDEHTNDSLSITETDCSGKLFIGHGIGARAKLHPFLVRKNP